MQLVPTETIWMDGEFVPWDEAKVHVLTPSLHYGWGVYEGVRAYETDTGPAVFRLRDHLTRLHDSARVYLMDPGYDVAELTEAALELMRRTGLASGYLRPIIYLGYGAMGVAPQLDAARVAIAAWPWGSYLGERADEEGCRLMVSSWQRNANHGVPPLAKATGAYVNSALTKVAAMRDAACACQDQTCLDKIQIPSMPSNLPDAARDLVKKLLDDAARCAQRIGMRQ